MTTYSYIELHQLLSDVWNASEKLSITYNEFEYLYTVHKAQNSIPDEMSHNDLSHLSSLASTMSIKKSSASIMLNKLEKKGFIKRVDCRYDSRAQHILLTDYGREVFNTTLETINRKITQHISSKLSKSDLDSFHSILTKIISPKQVKEK